MKVMYPMMARMRTPAIPKKVLRTWELASCCLQLESVHFALVQAALFEVKPQALSVQFESVQVSSS